MALLGDTPLKAPVEIIAKDKQHLRIRFIERIESCPRCQEGKGCGSIPWFKGLFKNDQFSLDPALAPKETTPFFELELSPSALKKLAILNYGLPLALFLTSLFFSQTLSLWQQALIAFFALALGIKLSQNLKNKILIKNLKLKPITKKHAQASLVVK